jgi:hypothetical protein
VARNVIAIQLALDSLSLRHERRLDELPREKLGDDDELVLLPIVATYSINVQSGNSLFGRFCD